MSNIQIQNIQVPGLGISIQEPSWLAKLLPANRVALISTWLVALGAFIYAIVGTLPNSWQRYALMATALLTKAVTVLKYLDGSQKSEALHHELVGKLIDHNHYVAQLENDNAQLVTQLGATSSNTVTKNQVEYANRGAGIEVGFVNPAPDYDSEPEPDPSVGAVSTSVEYSDEPPPEMAVLPDDDRIASPEKEVITPASASPGATSSVPDDQAGESS